MTQLLSRTGLRSQQFAAYDTTLAYEAGALVIYNGNVYQANDVIPANTAFAEGSVGQTWSAAVLGAGALSGNAIVNGTSNVTVAALDGDVTISSAGNANIVVVTGTGVNVSGTLDVTGDVTVANITANGKVNLGKVADVKIANGSNGQVLSTDGSGNLSWVSVSSSSISTGNSNVKTSNSSVTISANNQSSIVTVTSNGTHASTTINDDVTITGNLVIQGDTITTNVTTQAVQDTIMDLGVGANNTPLTSDDGLDRGIAMHTYGDGLVVEVAVAVALGDTFIELVDATGVVVGMEIGDDATSNYIPHGTTVIGIVGNTIEISTPTTGIIPLAEQLAIGLDNIRFMGWHQASSQFILADESSTTGGTLTVNSFGNLRADTLLGNVDGNTFKNGNSNITIAGNSNVTVSVGGTANVLRASTLGLEVKGALATTGNIGSTATNFQVNGNASVNIIGRDYSQLEWATDYANASSANTEDMNALWVDINGISMYNNVGGANQSAYFDTAGVFAAPTLFANTLANVANLKVRTSANLGAPANITITGGSNAQVLATDGAGNLTWQSVSALSGASSTTIYNGTSKVDVPTADGNVIVNVNGNATNQVVVTDTATYLNAAALHIADPLPRMGDGANVTQARGLTFPTWVQSASTTSSGATASGQTIINTALQNFGQVGGTVLYAGDRITSSTVPSAFAANTVVISATTTSITISPALVGTLTSGAALQITTPKHRFIGYDHANSEFAVSNNTGNVGDNNTPGSISTDGYANLHVGRLIADSGANLGAVANVYISGGSNGQFLKTDGSGNLTFANVSADKIYSGNSNVSVAANANVTISSNGIADIVVISANAGTSQLTLTGELVLDDVANLKVAGGNVGDYLTTDGDSVLSWSKASYGELNTESFTATAGQSVFVLAETPSGTVVMSINGAVMKASALDVASATVTYQAGNNSGYALRAGDIVTFTYQYGVTSTTLLSGISGLNINNPAQGEVLTYDSATGKWINAASGNANTYSLISNGTSRVQVTASGNVNTQVAGVANVTQVSTTGLTVNGKLEVSSDTTITGNLSVLGSTTTNSAQGLLVVNPIIEEGGPNTGSLTNNDGMDRGIIHNYYNTAPVKAFSGWKNSSDEFIFASNVANVNNVVTVATYGNVRANVFKGVGVNVTGNVTANLFTGTLTTQAQPNVTSLGNLNNLTSNGNVNFANATNVFLGAVANISITGGSNGQVLRTDGSGNLSWMAISSSAITNGNSNVSVIANGNVGISSAGNANIVIVTGTGANINGTANVTGALAVAGNAALANVTITGIANISANLTVSNKATIGGNITGNANIAITNDANIGGELLLTGNANVTGTINGSGNVKFTGSNVSLGNVANLHITGGSNAQVLTTDGSGTLTWVTPTMSSLNSETFTATAGQTSFTLSNEAVGRVIMAVNGAEIIKTAVSVSGTTVTYASATNGGYDLEAGDTVQFSYVYGTPTSVPVTLGSITNVTASSPTNGQLLAYDTTAGKWVNNSAKATTSAVRGTTVTLGNLIAKVSASGSVNVQIATALGTMTIVGSGTNVVGSTATSAAASQSLTTSFVSLASGWNLTTVGSTETWTIADTVTGNSWRITAIYTTTSGTASLTIERLN